MSTIDKGLGTLSATDSQISKFSVLDGKLLQFPVTGGHCETPSRSEPLDDGAPPLWDWLLLATIICGLFILVYGNFRYSLFQPLWVELQTHRWERLILRPSILWTVMGIALLTFRTIFWFRYRSFPAASFSDAPHLSVIIPAYNEGPMVLQSVTSVASAVYPRDRLEIFVVDDGSTDNTWQYVRQAAARYPGLVKPVRFPANRGKRAALAEGFRRASGELLVTIDSDSVIQPGSLLAIAGPFRDPTVGAVAGKVAVYNRRQGLIPRMLQVRYVLSFDLLRAVESSFRNVYCCPGALTAYRASTVRPVLQRWLNETFLGAPCTFGEDRALTNLILASGFDTVYQRSATVLTIVPATFSRLCKMFLRWDRGYVREELRFLRIVWRRPLRTRAIALCDRLITNLRFPVQYVGLFLILALIAAHPAMLVRVLLAVGFVSLFNTLYYLRSERTPDFFYGVVYSYFAMFTLFWIFPYAVITVRARSWLTR